MGVGAAAPIGPVNVEIARRTLRHGFVAGLLLGSGAVTVDVIYAIVSSLSIGGLLDVAWLRVALGIAGGILLAYLGVLSLLSIRKLRAVHIDGVEAAGPGPAESLARGPARRHYLTGLLMTLSNPMTLSFWFLAVPASAARQTAWLPMVCVGVFLATFAWVNLFAGLLTLLGRRRKDLWLIAADVLGGLTLLWFAGEAIWRVGVQLLS